MMNLQSNPLLHPSPLPYGLPPFDAIDAAHFRPAFESALDSHRQEMEAIATCPDEASFDNTIIAMERSGQSLQRVSAVFFGLIGTHTNDELQALQTELAPRLSSHWDAVLMDERLWRRIAALFDQREALGLSPEADRLLERYHTQFVRAGAQLDAGGKAQLKSINEALSSLTTSFQQRLLADTNARSVHITSESELDGLSAGSIASAKAAATAMGKEGWVITLVLPTGQPTLASLRNRSVRQRVFEASAKRGQTEEGGTLELIPRIARLRASRAQILGYDTHADYVLADRTAKSAAAVHEMLDRIVPAAVRNANEEAEDIRALLEADGFETLEPWDWAFYSERVRQQKHAFDMDAMTPYLELERVLHDGAFHAAELLYGLTFEERSDLPVYHPDVRIFEVARDGSAFGLFVFDPYARPSKRGGAWMSSYVKQSGLLEEGPVAANHLNVPRPPDGSPTLLTFEEVTTLFHEFGHALHGLLSDVHFPYFSGLSVPWDFVEFPSQLNEFWSTWPSILERYARHFETGEPMPAELVAKFQASKTFNEGFATTEYLAAAIVDLSWHELSPDEVPDDVLAFEKSALEGAGLALHIVPPRYRSPYFAHVFAGGYAAGYYSYIWAEVLDADAAKWFEANGGPTRENGEKLRQSVLSRGGSRDAMAMYREFRGEDAAIEPLLERRGLI